jgi:serine/threonine protein phosphatase PrpC
MASFFQKLFGQTQPQKSSEVPTEPIEYEKPRQVVAAKPKKQPMDPPQLIVGCAQSTGMQRYHNEDSLFTLTTTLSSPDSNMPFGLYIVADGMGGHQHGEQASATAVRVLGAHMIGELYSPLFSPNPTPPTSSIQEIMDDGVQAAHRQILHDVQGGGTTLTAILIRGEQMTIAHVGDSRAYTVSEDGKMEVLTRDHSLVQRLVELGQITDEEAAVHPQKNVLYRALGQGEPFSPDISTSPTPKGGYLLICSDGLWGVVSEEQMTKTISESANPQEACSAMVAAANESGGPDNITAILVHLPD